MIYKLAVPSCFLLFLNLSVIAQSRVAEQHTIPYKNIYVQGELLARLTKNYDRLETETYMPATIFRTSNQHLPVEWPGDIEGRLILGLVLQAQATHREPKYLSEIIRLLPAKVNSGGYFGPLQKDTINEQQLSGNGWYLRGLCEYYQWKKDPKIKAYITKVITNLVLPTKGQHSTYPIDPASRQKNVGAASGTTQAAVGNWKLSSDIGCDFIFLDGVVSAYEILPSDNLRDLIEEMIDRYLQLDLRAMNAQTHASLTGLRSLLRYYVISKKSDLLAEVKKRYSLYRSYATTANFENYNWFGRPEWTEPCGIVDSYMLALQLWQLTQNPLYLEDAHHIYYNAIANTQRANGGFGLSNCARPGSNSLYVDIDEASWCCTMRGAEGLASAARYSYFTETDQLLIPFFGSSIANIHMHQGSFRIKQISGYPFHGTVKFIIQNSTLKVPIQLKLFAPSWTTNHILTINGIQTPIVVNEGFISFRRKLKQGDNVKISFSQLVLPVSLHNKQYNTTNLYTLNYGPLLLGIANKDKSIISFTSRPDLKRINKFDWIMPGTQHHLSPIYHLMNPAVSKQSGYSKQVIFEIKDK